MDIQEFISYNEHTGEFTALKSRGKIKEGVILGSRTVLGYLTLTFNNKSYLCHRLAFFFKTGYFPENDVDHINGNRSDNRWCNLRIATRQQNLFNKTGNKGRESLRNVYPHKSGKFRVKMKINGITTHFGYYSTVEEAISIANSVRKEHHQEFAKAF